MLFYADNLEDELKMTLEELREVRTQLQQIKTQCELSRKPWISEVKRYPCKYDFSNWSNKCPK